MGSHYSVHTVFAFAFWGGYGFLHVFRAFRAQQGDRPDQRYLSLCIYWSVSMLASSHIGLLVGALCLLGLGAVCWRIRHRLFAVQRALCSEWRGFWFRRELQSNLEACRSGDRQLLHGRPRARATAAVQLGASPHRPGHVRQQRHGHQNSAVW